MSSETSGAQDDALTAKDPRRFYKGPGVGGTADEARKAGKLGPAKGSATPAATPGKAA